MKLQWLNLILHLTSAIYQKKEKLILSTLFGSIGLALQIVLMELVLFLISLPTYLFIREEKDFSPISAHKEKEIASYRMRRKFTVSLFVLLASAFLAWLLIRSISWMFFYPRNVVSTL